MSWGRKGLFPCLCSWSFMRLHVETMWGLGEAFKGARSPTSMTNSNPSRFLISSTKYLGERVRKHTWRKGRGKETAETYRGPRKATESGREGDMGPSCLPGESKGLVDAPLQPLPTLCLPHEPQLQTVDAAATLHHLVSGVQSHIVELILLEEVAGLGSVATLEQVLWGGSYQQTFLRCYTAGSQLSLLSPPWSQAASTEAAASQHKSSSQIPPQISPTIRTR